MSATARLVKMDAGAPPKAPETGEEKTAPAESATAKAEAAPAAAPAKADAPEGRGKKGIAYRGLCIYCGARIEIAVDKREISTFAFCNAECRARFDAEMNEALD